MIELRDNVKVKLNKRASVRQESKHPWVYDNEIESIDGNYSNGDIVDVVNYKDKYVGTGFINDNSKIRVRIASRNANDLLGPEFFERRIRYSIDYRLNVMESIDNARLIFGESDGFSGLTVDKYNRILVTEVLSLALEMRKETIYESIIKVLNEYGYEIDGIYEKNDSDLRDKEGLDRYEGFYGKYAVPDYTETIIEENGIKYIVDFQNGQKTGFFLDQKYNRLAIRSIAKNKNVLDVCTCTGSFGFNAYAAGAKKVVSIDVSKSSLDLARRNAMLNGFDIEYVESDAFDYLDSIHKGDFDFIILDPPAFTKSRNTVKAAARGYEELNYKAIMKLNRGDYLATCSCSHFMNEEMFLDNIKRAAFRAGRELKLVEARKQSKDHPILINVPETDYLKFFIFEVI